MIHKFSEVSSKAQIAEDVEIGPFCQIADDVVIGKGCKLIGNVTILDGARIGENNIFFPGSVISAVPQDLKFRGEYTTLELGDNNTIRECVTLNRGTASRGKTVIGSNNLIMAYCHVGHDCVLGSHIVISNATQIAGEVEIDDWAVIGGASAIMQFSKIGCHSMTSGQSGVTKDIPPFAKSGHNPPTYVGINSVGLRRRNFTDEQITNINNTYRILYQRGLNTTSALKAIEEEIPDCEEKRIIVDFINRSEHGILKGPKID